MKRPERSQGREDDFFRRFVLRPACAAFAVGMALALPAQAVRDPADVEGTEEPPAIARFPNFFIDNSKHNDFNAVRFPVARGEVEQAGHYWFVDYILKEGARQPSTIELIRNHENAFRAAGGTMVRRDDDGATYRVPLAAGGERWVRLNVDNDGYRYQLTVVDVGAMAQKLEYSADEMAAALQSQGKVALHGIHFETGSAVILADSKPLLAEVAGLMAHDASLRLSVVGHTDDAGNARANQQLSLRRAESVVAALVADGVEARRLRAEGRGADAPVADNRSADGRSQNRRVELVRWDGPDARR